MPIDRGSVKALRMDEARFAPLSELQNLRGDRDCVLELDGLWVRGAIDALRKPCVAIVGTRAATGYGRRIARSIARDLAASGCCIVSGLALGIDACAHEGALDAGAPTAGVLGAGHKRFFPARNRELAERMIAQSGAVLSPFPPEWPAQPHQFLQRNGVVAALSDAVVVIEAPARSGALNTAGWAAGRIPVFAVPGDVDRPHVAGCHALLRDGAILARNALDVLEVLSLDPAVSTNGVRPQRDELDERLLCELESGEADLDTLARRLEAAPALLLASLSVLELDGEIERRGNRFARTGQLTLLS